MKNSWIISSSSLLIDSRIVQDRMFLIVRYLITLKKLSKYIRVE